MTNRDHIRSALIDGAKDKMDIMLYVRRAGAPVELDFDLMRILLTDLAKHHEVTYKTYTGKWHATNLVKEPIILANEPTLDPDRFDRPSEIKVMTRDGVRLRQPQLVAVSKELPMCWREIRDFNFGAKERVAEREEL